MYINYIHNACCPGIGGPDCRPRRGRDMARQIHRGVRGKAAKGPRVRRLVQLSRHNMYIYIYIYDMCVYIYIYIYTYIYIYIYI